MIKCFSFPVFVACALVAQLCSAQTQTPTSPEVPYKSFQTDALHIRLGYRWVKNHHEKTSALGLSIFLGGFLNMRCTVTLISPEGHLLLARHCLEETIGLSERFRGEENVFSPMLTLEKTNESLTVSHYNPTTIEKILQIPFKIDEHTYYASVVAIGPGELFPRFANSIQDEETQRRHFDLTNQGYSAGGDFAILKVDELKGQKCYKLAGQKVSVTQKVHRTSFPCLQEQGKEWPQLRAGKVLEVAPDAGLMSSTFIPRDHFISDEPAEECNSGSAIFNEQNEIVGILNAGIPERTSTGFKINSMSISTKRMLELLPESQKNKILRANAACTGN